MVSPRSGRTESLGWPPKPGARIETGVRVWLGCTTRSIAEMLPNWMPVKSTAEKMPSEERGV